MPILIFPREDGKSITRLGYFLLYLKKLKAIRKKNGYRNKKNMHRRK